MNKSIANKIANKITQEDSISPLFRSNWRNEHDKETPNEKYISPEERQDIIDDLTLV